MSDGTLWAWGYNFYGQLGDGTTTSKATPVQIKGLGTIKTIGAAWGNTYVVRSDGSVWIWGSNGYGEVGDGTRARKLAPQPLTSLTGVTAVATMVDEIGDPLFHPVGEYSATLKSDGSVWTWGDNTYGQLGDGSKITKNVPVQVSGLTDATDIATGSEHCIALKSDGTAWAWGRNRGGRLGDGTTTARLTPVQVLGLTGVVDVAAGEEHSAAVKSDGTVWAWGYNGSGQLGDGSWTTRTTPVRVAGLENVVAISSGLSSSLALKSDGTLWGWGDNCYGQLGDGGGIPRLTPVQVAGLGNITAVSGPCHHAVALRNDGTVWTWGKNYYGQLGDGTTTARLTPIQVPGMTDVVSVGACILRTVAAKSDGTIWGWGYGVLNDGRDSRTPVQIARIAGVTSVCVSDYGYVARTADGRVWTWGGGWLGDGHSNQVTLPYQMTGPDTIAPTGSISINNGKSFTKVADVTLNLSCIDDTVFCDVRISDDGTFDTEPWQRYSPAMAWTLPSGVGNETVYAKFRDYAGNESETVSDSILLVPGVPVDVKTAEAGSSVAAPGVVTAVLSDCIYIESPDRASGIRVSPAPSGASIDNLVYVVGTMAVTNGEMTIVPTDCLTISPGSVKPLGPHLPGSGRRSVRRPGRDQRLADTVERSDPGLGDSLEHGIRHQQHWPAGQDMGKGHRDRECDPAGAADLVQDQRRQPDRSQGRRADRSERTLRGGQRERHRHQLLRNIGFQPAAASQSKAAVRYSVAGTRSSVSSPARRLVCRAFLALPIVRPTRGSSGLLTPAPIRRKLKQRSLARAGGT